MRYTLPLERLDYRFVESLALRMKAVMMKRFSWCVLALALFSFDQARAQEPTARKPNIILFLADDIGAAELGCYGNKEHSTPNLDRLAAEGLKLDTFYAMPLCTTTRMALMTGQYGFRNGYLGMNNKAYIPAPQSPQRNIASHFTNGKLMKSAGYATAQVGKWQLSGNLPNLIHEAGFDEYRMWAYMHNLPKGVEHQGRWEGKPGKSNTARYWHPSLVENGKYIPTGPDDYGPDLLNQFVFRFIQQHSRDPYFIYYTSLLTHGPHEETPDPAQPGKRLPKGFKSNVEYLDFIMGQLIDQLKKQGQDKNTVLIFIGDNGTAGNGKGSATELGARVPFIAWGPGLVKPAQGAHRALADVTDIFPTLAELSGAEIPQGLALDGRSLVGLLSGKRDTHREWIYSHLNDGRVLRDAHWLLEIRGGDNPTLFYDCKDDRTGKEYVVVEGQGNHAAQAARKQMNAILAAMPTPKPRTVEKSE